MESGDLFRTRLPKAEKTLPTTNTRQNKRKNTSSKSFGIHPNTGKLNQTGVYQWFFSFTSSSCCVLNGIGMKYLLLCKAIIDVAVEHAYDHTQLRVHFEFCVRGGRLTTPSSPWPVALGLGADLVDALPPQGRVDQWLSRGVTVETEAIAWQGFKQKCLEKWSDVPAILNQLASI
eukprot:6213753-Amphidinium_carterae.2